MKLNGHSHTDNMALRYIAITGSTAKSCRKLKTLLKHTGYYCLIDCYKHPVDLEHKDSFYLPDYVIMEIRSLYAMFSVGKKIESLQDVFPNIKVILYYNMLRRCPLLEQKHGQYPTVYAGDEEEKQLHQLSTLLQQE
ncbi:MAG: hypothetical protein ABI685_08465 [Ferruginibacter sp.]